MTDASPTPITVCSYRLALIPAHTVQHPAPIRAHLLCILFKQAKLKALVQLQLADVPGLVQPLPGGVQLVQQLRDPRHQALGVGVTNATAATTGATAASTPTAAAITVQKGLAALNPLEQPGNRCQDWLNSDL